MRKIILGAVLLGLGACTTAQLQTEATRLAAINTIICKADQSAPQLVALVSTITSAVNPSLAPGVLAADAVDAAAHKALQDACPVNATFLAAIEAGTDPAVALASVSASAAPIASDVVATVGAVKAVK